jgi:anti-sigma factor RsiW
VGTELVERPHPFADERRNGNVGAHAQFADWPALYVIGALSADDTAAFEAHLATCAACAGDVDDFTAVAEALARATSQEAPAAEVRSALLARIRPPR